MLTPIAPAPLPGDINPADMLRGVLDVSLTALQLLRPIYAPDGATIVDFTPEYTNPAGLRMLGFAQQPSGTMLSLFPHTLANGTLAYYVRAFAASEVLAYELNYQADGLDNYFRVQAQRQGALLLVSFTDTSDQPRSAVELALRDSQVAEQTARAEAERQRQRFHEVLMQLPAYVAVYHGPDHVYQFVNPPYQSMFPYRSFAGRLFTDAMPEASGLGVVALFDRVYQTGEPYQLRELEGWFDFRGTGELERVFLDLYLQPLRNAQGQVDGVLDYSHNVTEQVLARRQVEQLNQELESRVQARTHELAEQQALLGRILGQAPAAVATFSGPAHRFSFFNAQYQRLAHGRAAYGLPMAEAVPEATAQGFVALLDQVHQTGQPFVGNGLPIELRQPDDTLTEHYFNFVFQPLHDSQGQVSDILAFAVEVTAQVQASRQNEALQAEVLATARYQVQQREAFYQIFEQTPALVALLRAPGHRYEYVNPAYQALFAGRQLVGLNSADAVPELQTQGFAALLDRVYQTGETHSGQEVPFVRQVAAGQPPRTDYFNFTYQAYRESGQVAGISVFAFDVTEQVLARQMRDNQRRELTVLFEQAPAGVCILDGPELVYTFANPAYQQILPSRELLGRSVLDVIPELRGSEVERLLRQVYATGEAYRAREVCIPLAGPDGSGELENRYFTLVYQPRRDDDQRVTGLLNLVVEVTEQVQARQQADAAAAELRLLTAHSPAFLFRTDAAGSLEYLNKEFFDWTGLDASRLPSLDEGWAVVHPTDLAGQQPSFAAAVQAGQPWQSTPYRFRRHDGQYRWMLSRSQPLFGPDGQVMGHGGLTFEVHEQVELQQQLTRTNVDLDNFIYTASHDLKAPITNIEGLLLALEHELPAAARTGDVPLMLTMMQDAVDRFRRTITHLTDLSRLQKEHNPASDAVALGPVVEAVRLDIMPLLAHTDGQLTVSIPEGLMVTFAEKNLRSVVYNLLSNAFKYRHPDRVPEVQLRASLNDEYVVLEVQDNGLGLDLSRGQERLFGMFQRLHTHVEGTGVGLYMVKRILENAGGRIEVSSELGYGSTFRVYFRR